LSSSLLTKNLKIKIYLTVLPFVLNGCETWSLAISLFENKTYGYKTKEVTGGWREFRGMYPSVRVMKPTVILGGLVASVGVY
jgi:hypothetical protein